MGIPGPVARAILQEHRHRPITGNGLLIGRQTMPFTVNGAMQMLAEEGVPIRAGASLDSSDLLDNTTRYGKETGQISDYGFFSLFSDAKFKAIDVTDYEGAEIVHDMCTAIPRNLENTVDFLWNGSCLDNMFDPATAMRNTVKLLRPGGRAFLMEIGTPHHNAYTMYSPAYFFDYFAINDFDDCKVYVCLFPFENIHSADFDVFAWKTHDAMLGQFPIEKAKPGTCLLNFVIAEKGVNSTWDMNPIQGQYRPDHGVYRSAFSKFKFSRRPEIRKPFVISELGKYSDIFSTHAETVDFLGTWKNGPAS